MKYSDYFSMQVVEKVAKKRNEIEKRRKFCGEKGLSELHTSDVNISQNQQTNSQYKEKPAQNKNLDARNVFGYSATNKSYINNAYLDKKHEEVYVNERAEKEGYQRKSNYDVANELGISKTKDNRFYKKDGTEVSEDWLSGGFYAKKDADSIYEKMIRKRSLNIEKSHGEKDNKKTKSFLDENSAKKDKMLYNNDKYNKTGMGNHLIKPVKVGRAEEQNIRLSQDEQPPLQNAVIDTLNIGNSDDYEQQSNEFFMNETLPIIAV